MDYVIEHKPSYSLIIVRLAEGESIAAEAGSMVSMTAGIKLETTTRGGIMGSLKRSVLGGESFFVNRLTAEKPGMVMLAPPLSGDCEAVTLEGNGLIIQSTSYIACQESVEIDTKFGGLKGLMSGEGLFFLHAKGNGVVFISSYGAIRELKVTAGNDMIIDTGHIVAFDEALSWKVERVGGLKSTLLSGEGLVARFSGEGRVWLQTRSPGAFLSWLIPKIPAKSN